MKYKGIVRADQSFDTPAILTIAPSKGDHISPAASSIVSIVVAAR